MVSVDEWGPDLWKLLHSYSLYAGKNKPEIAALDEVRGWKTFIIATEAVLPCRKCKDHMREWRLKNPIEVITPYRGEYLKERVCSWLWELHESVNEKRGIPKEQRLPIDLLAEKYSTSSIQSLSQTITNLTEKFEKAVLHRQIDPPYLREWKRALLYLTRFIS
jgi:hypothetical protein